MFFSRCFSSSWLSLLLWLTTALAQQGHNKLQLREPSFRISQTGKASIAKSALDLLVDGLNSSSGIVTDPSPGLDIPQSATFIQTLSRYDQLTVLPSTPDRPPLENSSSDIDPPFQITLHSDTARWGLAAYYASTVYDGQTQISFLEGAKAAWDLLQPFQLSPDIASSGHLSSIDATFEPECNGASVQGAVLWLEAGNVLTNTETMGPYIALSSYLYNATHNETYSHAANLAIGFMKTFLSDGKTPTHDSIYLNNCTMGVPNNFTYNSGYFVEGLAAYTAMTGDDSQQDYLNSFVQSLLLVPEWYRSEDYVMKGGTFSNTDYALIDSMQPDEQTLANSRLTSDWKSIYLSGLYTCLRFGLLEPKLAQWVSALIAVQYNAIRELANSTVSGQIAYSPSWTSQPLQVLTAWGQLAAAEVLTTALNVTTDRDTTTDTSWMYPPGSSNPTSSFDPWSGSAPTGGPPPPGVGAVRSSGSPVGAVVGGLIGGLGGLALVALIVLFFLKRRRNARSGKVMVNPFSSTDSTHTNSTIEPFLLPGPTVSRTPATQQVLGTDGRVTKLQAQRYGPTPSEGGWSARPPGSYAPDPAYADPEDGAGPSGAPRGTLDEQRIHTLLTRLTNVLAQVGRLEERRTTRDSGRRTRNTARSPAPFTPADEEKGYGWG
ncbi:unnamed protein product [Peniophora sp. CBMAI 1063]|nr:unnamed protein product [Peniophora sp. CBMAI 1063]